MVFISVATPQNLQYHQKGERERRKAGDIYKHCDTAKPTIPSEGRERGGGKLVIFISVVTPQNLQYHQKGERDRRKAGDIYKSCDTAKPTKPSEGREGEREREREREGEGEEFLLIKMSRFVSYPLLYSGPGLFL